MKPICLTIQGLHSFREKQTIRFDELSDAGVFGIFGPTGSGKSTILDAITLALYGTVGRAKNGTQGILNHGEKKLEITFQFQLGSGADSRIYRIDRRYDRNQEITVKNGLTRLVELDASGEVLTVLSTNAREVSKMVEDLLGLKEEDFSRAVVLPQGKFQEFLHLNGKDRRLMLQRLFGLEQYGTQLTIRLNQRFNETAGLLSTVKAEQEGMGDCSRESLIAAEAVMNEAKQQEQIAAAELRTAHANFDSAKQMRDTQQLLLTVEEQLRVHAANADEINLLSSKLDLSERASQVLPFINRFEAAQEAERTRLAEQQALEQSAAVLRPEVQALLHQWDTAKQQLANRSPELIRRQTQLETATEWENEVESLTSRVNELTAERQQVTAELERHALQINNVVAEQEAAQVQEQVLKETLHHNQVSPEHRALVQEARSKKQILVQAQQALLDANTQYEKRCTFLQQCEQQVSDAEARLVQLREHKEAEEKRFAELSANAPATDQQIAQQTIHITELKGKLDQLLKLARDKEREERKASDWEKELARLTFELESTSSQLEAAQAALSEQKANYQDAVLHNKKTLAIQLATDLQHGEACPVCGSHEHPNPTVMTDLLEAGSNTLEEMQQNLQQADEAERVLLEQLGSQKATLNGKNEQLQELRTSVAAITVELNELATELRTGLSAFCVTVSGAEELGAEDLAALFAAETKRIEQLRIRFGEWKEQMSSFEAAGKALDEEINEIASHAAVAQQKADTARVEMENALKLQTRCEESVHSADQELQKVLEALGAESVETAAADLSTKDELVKRAQEQLLELEKRMNSLRQQLVEARQQEASLQVKVATALENLRNAEEQLLRKQQELNKVTDGIAAADLLSSVWSELVALEERTKSAETAYTQTLIRLQETEQQLAQAQARYEEAVNTLDVTKQEMERRLDEFDIETADQVKDAVLLPEELSQAKERVQKYRESGNSLLAQKTQLENQLQGQSITEEAWEQVTDRLHQAEQIKQQASEYRAVTEAEYKMLAEKHIRWQHLEEQAAALQKETGYLAQLKNLLKGERFVEFLAQEQLQYVCQQASERLKRLTRDRYTLEINEDGFVMRDDANGGYKRPVTTLSGGETFLTSLALALSLSSQIQLRGKYPLEFFFLDEGFGTLDQELLDVVMSSLQQLHLENMTIGVISHVPELQQRLHRRLIVEPAEAAGRGTVVRVERN